MSEKKDSEGSAGEALGNGPRFGPSPEETEALRQRAAIRMVGLLSTFAEHSKPLAHMVPGARPVRASDKKDRPVTCQAETPYIDRLMLEHEMIVAMRGKTVIDLGAGMSNKGFCLACDAGAKGYVGVEPNHAWNLTSSIGGELQRLREANATAPDVHVAEHDMLDLLRSLPDDAENVCILMSGIDAYILIDVQPPDHHRDDVFTGARWSRIHIYEQNLLAELTRTLGTGSSIVLNHSMIKPDAAFFDRMYGDTLGHVRWMGIYERNTKPVVQSELRPDEQRALARLNWEYQNRRADPADASPIMTEQTFSAMWRRMTQEDRDALLKRLTQH